MKNKIAKLADYFLLLIVPAGISLFAFFEPSSGQTVVVDAPSAIRAFGVVFGLFLLLLIKKKKLDPYFKDVRHILNNHRADYAVENNADKKQRLATEIKKRGRLVLIYERVSILVVLVALYLVVSYVAKNIADLQTVIGLSIASISAGSFVGLKWGVKIEDDIKIPGDK